MRWRDRSLVAGVAVAVVLAAGCARDGASGPDTTTLSTPAAAAAAGTAVTRAGDRAPSATSEPTVDKPAAAAGSAPDLSVPATVEVSGGELPAQIVDGYATNGGDLVSDEEWTGRFGASGLPRLSGPGVTLAEAVRRVEQRDGGWVRTDEASWLAMSSDDRDTVLRAVAAAAGVRGTPTRTGSTEEAADCVIDAYPAVDGVEWTIQGCAYERFSQMIAVGVSRTAPTDTAPGPTVNAIIGELAGTVTFSEVRFGSPGPDGSTLHLSTQVTTGVDVDAARAAVTAGPLAGWQTFPGEGSLLLSGPSGGTWTLSDRVAVFAWAGRW